MAKAKDRKFEALNYGKGEKALLTKNQYLVYAYLMSISKWDAQDNEQHYYVYKNSFVQKEASKQLGITPETFRKNIKSLEKELYIKIFDKYYIIEIPDAYVPLQIELIKLLLNYGSAINNGGNIVSVYSLLCRYWQYCKNNDTNCEICINQIMAIFQRGSRKNDIYPYKIMLALFEHSGLIKLKRVTKQYCGKDYTAYIIQKVELSLPKELDLDKFGPSNIDNILKALEEKEG